MSFFLLILGSMTAFEVVDCHPQTGNSVNTTFCTSIIGGAGDNQITVDKDQTISGPFFGDGVIGNGGNDVIINNSTTVSGGSGTGRNGDIEGDVATGNGGDDVIVNNGIVASDMDGDTALDNGGNDVLINNGSTGDDMDGDNAGKNGGDDLIINNGVVGGDIQADDNEDTANSRGGNDIIVINGTVDGYVDGDAGVKTGGDDLVILQNGANGGDDKTLLIDGNGGDDSLEFDFAVTDEAALYTLIQQIASAKASRDSLTWNDQTYQWVNFEHLYIGLYLQGSSGPFISVINGQTRTVIDPSNAGIYCEANKLTAVGLDSEKRSEWLFTVKSDDLKAGLAQAANSKADVTIAKADGQTLSALASGELQLSDASGRYSFTVSRHDVYRC